MKQHGKYVVLNCVVGYYLWVRFKRLLVKTGRCGDLKLLFDCSCSQNLRQSSL